MPLPFTKMTAIAAPIMRTNVDTDVIISINRMIGNSVRGHLGKWAFGSLRYLPDGSDNPAFILNREPYRAAEILVTDDETSVSGLHGRDLTAISRKFEIKRLRTYRWRSKTKDVS